MEEYLWSFHQQKDWEKYLATAEFSYYSSVHAGHRHTPFFLKFWTEPSNSYDCGYFI